MATIEQTGSSVSVRAERPVDFSSVKTRLRFDSSTLFQFFRLPQAAWLRLLVLFVALAGIKLALIVRLGKQLFEAHWRLTPHEPVWGDYLLFGFFVVICFVSLMRLQRH
jgi:hypothetical protein